MTAMELLHDLQAGEMRLTATGDRLTAVGHRARRRLDALPLEAVVAQIAALAAGELLALVRHRRPRLVPGEEPPAAAVAERLVQMTAEELQELGRRLRERRAAEA